MLAAMNNQELLLRDLIEKGLGGQGHGKTQFCPLDFRQMKVCGDDAIDLSCDLFVSRPVIFFSHVIMWILCLTPLSRAGLRPLWIKTTP